jgi:hypothetical protein
LVNKTQDGQFTDHVNGFKLDNTSINLRTANKSQNACNCPKRNDGSSSRFKGVRWDEKRKTWVAYLSGGKNKHLGQFDSEEKAAEAYNRAAKEKYGDFAKLNVVSQP